MKKKENLKVEGLGRRFIRSVSKRYLITKEIDNPISIESPIVEGKPSHSPSTDLEKTPESINSHMVSLKKCSDQNKPISIESTLVGGKSKLSLAAKTKMFRKGSQTSQSPSTDPEKTPQSVKSHKVSFKTLVIKNQKLNGATPFPATTMNTNLKKKLVNLIDENRANQNKSKEFATITILMVTGIYLIFNFPVSVFTMIELIDLLTDHKYDLLFTEWNILYLRVFLAIYCVGLNSALNPIVYFYR